MHDTGEGHPEDARRLSAIEDQFISSGLSDFIATVSSPFPLKRQQKVQNSALQ